MKNENKVNPVVMGFREILMGEDPIEVKPSTLFELMSEAAKAEYMMKALKCGTPSAYIIATFGSKEDLEEVFDADEELDDIMCGGDYLPDEDDEEDENEYIKEDEVKLETSAVKQDTSSNGT